MPDPNSGAGNGNPPANGGDQGSLGLGNAGGSSPREWMKGLPEPLKASKSLEKFESPEAVFKSYVELEGKLGRSVQIPDQSATAEDWGKFFSRIGRPESPEGYDVPAGKLDKSFEDRFRKAALAAGMTKAQAKVLAEDIAAYNDQAKAAQALAREQSENLNIQTLKATFGPKLDAVMEKANKAFNTTSPTFRQKIEASGLARDPEVINFFATLADEMGEDRLIPGGFGPKPKPADPYDWMRAKYGQKG